MARHYLDHASTSPLRPEALAAMEPWLAASVRGEVGDPGRLHQEGMHSRVALEEAREQLATLVGARPREVVFTSGATEAIAAAVWGAAERGGTIVVPAVEHSAVRQSSELFGSISGAPVAVVGVDAQGRVDPDEVMAATAPGTGLVHVQWGNHEVGTIQPVAEIVRRCRAQGVLVHVDAAQAAGRVPIGFDDLGADLLSISGHKFGGPPGTGALVVRRGLRLRPLLMGGDQERARRAGVENVPALMGLGAAAAALAEPDRLATEEAAARARTERLLAAVTALDGVHGFGDPVGRLPHLICVGIDGIEPQAVLLVLDRAGIAAHSGSACASEGVEDSPVLAAMGADAHRSLRLSVGWSTTDTDIDAVVAALPTVVAQLRALAP